MLVLSRKLGQSILLPQHNVTITILALTQGRVKIGITAPGHLVVHREEVWRRTVHALPEAATALPVQG